MAKSHFQQEQYPSTHFVESAGTILFDFRHTNITTNTLLNHRKTPSPTPSASTSTPALEPHIILIKHTSTPTPSPSPSSILTATSTHTHDPQILLPKGRLNNTEPRSTAALRETREETGHKSHLLPITLHSRATSADPSRDNINHHSGAVRDEVRTFPGSATEPFMLTVRHVSREVSTGERVKLIWWFVAVVDDGTVLQDGDGDGSGNGDSGEEVEMKVPVTTLDSGCEAVGWPVREAADMCTYQSDRDVVRRAVEIVQESLGWKWVG